MNNTTNFFAVDLGATSGRTILGSIIDGKLQMIQTHVKEQPKVTVTYF